MTTFRIDKKHRIEQSLRIATGIVLSGVSAGLTVSLFISLAGGNFPRQIVMTILALGLEASKILLFRSGRGYRIIAGFLIGISILSSYAAALQVVEDYRVESVRVSQVETQTSDAYRSMVDEIASLDTQITICVERLSGMPSNYIKASTDLIAQIDSLRTMRAKTMTRMSEIGNPVASPSTAHGSMFSLIAKELSVDEDSVVFCILMILSILLEVTALALFSQSPTEGGSRTRLSYRIDGTHRNTQDTTFPQDKMSDSFIQKNGHDAHHDEEPVNIPESGNSTGPTMSYEAPMLSNKPMNDVSPMEFLAAMAEGLEFPLLRGRDTTAERLGGITPYKAKQLVSQLMEAGLIEAKGKRLFRTELWHSQTEKAKAS